MAASSPKPVPTAPPPPPPPNPTPSPRVRDLVEEHAVRHEAVRAERWTVRGIAKVTGEVDVGEGRVVGTLVVGGRLVAGRFSVEGTLEGEGPVEVTGAFEVDGEWRATAAVHVGNLAVRGSGRAGSEVRVDGAVEVRGSLTAPSLRATGLHAVGALHIRGPVTATTVDATFRTTSRLGSVTATEVTLATPAKNPIEIVFGRRWTVEVERVEASHARVTGVEVGFLRADTIELGAGAKVRELQGTVTKRHPSAFVGPRSESPPPPGLSR